MQTPHTWCSSAPHHMHCVTCNTVTRSHGVNRDGTSSNHGWDVQDSGVPRRVHEVGGCTHACMQMLASHASAGSMVTPLSSCISLTAASLMVSPTSTLPPNPLAFPAPNPLFFRPSKMRPFDRSRSSVRRFGPAAAAAAMIPSPFNGSRRSSLQKGCKHGKRVSVLMTSQSLSSSTGHCT
jgi:hypothetical protein